jgi:N-formylglutamate amidohydrolase
VRSAIVLNDDALTAELDLMTDAHTDVIAEQAATAAISRPYIFVNQLSRLVVDPERFTDEQEVMRAVGMGAVYTRTSAGARLRDDDPGHERELLDRWFHPYAQSMADLVDERLAVAGRVTVIDVHSYPSQRLPYEIGPQGRPAICLGVDEHTPDWLLAAATEAFAGAGDIDVNTPFAGCYVPLRHYESKDSRVTAIMVEIRRDTYMVEPRGPSTEGVASMGARLAALIDAIDRR